MRRPRPLDRTALRPHRVRGNGRQRGTAGGPVASPARWRARPAGDGRTRHAGRRAARRRADRCRRVVGLRSLPRAGGCSVTVRLVLADDQAVVRAGFRTILDSEPDIEVVGEAGGGEEAVRVARRLEADLVVMDVRMPGMDGITATAALAGPDVPRPIAVLVVTTFDLNEYVFAALRAGASGFRAGSGGMDEACATLAGANRLLSDGPSRRALARKAPHPRIEPRGSRSRPAIAWTDEDRSRDAKRAARTAGGKAIAQGAGGLPLP